MNKKTPANTGAASCDHKPRKRRSVLDPPVAVANTSVGESSARYAYYFCGCGQLNRVHATSLLEAA
jgi:hypothetical protein